MFLFLFQLGDKLREDSERQERMMLALRDNLENSQRENKYNETIENEHGHIHCVPSLPGMPCNML